MKRLLFLGLLAACRQPSAADLLARGRWVDLSYAFDSTTIYWPTAQPFRLQVVSAQRTPKGYYYAANNFAAAEHGGTHLDAPVHFAEGRHTTDQIPLTQLVGPAVVIDTRGASDADRDYRITSGDLTQWETAHGSIPEGTIVLFRTGWGTRWPDRARYLGTLKTGQAAVAELHFPGIDSSAARWLVGRRVRHPPDLARGRHPGVRERGAAGAAAANGCSAGGAADENQRGERGAAANRGMGSRVTSMWNAEVGMRNGCSPWDSALRIPHSIMPGAPCAQGPPLRRQIGRSPQSSCRRSA